MKKAFTFLLITLAVMTTELYAQAAAESAESAAGGEFILSYPDYMKERGFEDTVMDHYPERVAVMLTKPVRTLYALGVSLIAVPTAGSLPWPEGFSVQQFEMSYNRDFNIEGILLLNPDLVVLGDYQKDTYGALFSQLGIPVYYVDNTSGFTYENTKAEVRTLCDAFDPSGENSARVMASFDEYEKKAEAFAPRSSGKKVLILQNMGTAWSYQDEGGTVGMAFKQLGFENIYSTRTGTMPFSYEGAFKEEPRLIVFVGSSNDHEANVRLVETELADRSDYWNSFKAIREGSYLVLERRLSVIHGVSIFEQQDEIIRALEEAGY